MSNYIERYWRDAKPEDAIKEPPMVARFRAGINQEWIMDTLQGIDRSEPSKWRGKDVTCRYCQVYDAPDPGEGWRLIDIDKEKPEPTDEYLRGRTVWVPKGNSCDFVRHLTYRRRITPAITYVPFTWEDREQLRGRWVYRDKDGYIMEEVAFRFDSRAFDVVAKHLLDDGWKFLDTGKPVGKEVVQ